MHRPRVYTAGRKIKGPSVSNDLAEILDAYAMHNNPKAVAEFEIRFVKIGEAAFKQLFKIMMDVATGSNLQSNSASNNKNNKQNLVPTFEHSINIITDIDNEVTKKIQDDVKAKTKYMFRRMLFSPESKIKLSDTYHTKNKILSFNSKSPNFPNSSVNIVNVLFEKKNEKTLQNVPFGTDNKNAPQNTSQNVNNEKLETIPGLMYNIVLSEEYDITEGEFSTNKDSSLIRIKNRASFVVGKWRYDFTVVKKMPISAISQLKMAKDKIFEINTPAQILGNVLTEYDFSVEIEYIGNEKYIMPEDIRDAVVVFKPFISQGNESVNSQYTDAIKEVGKLISPSGFHASLKNVLNQAMIMNKNDYAEIFPPHGYYVTDKADGVRACAMLSDGVLKILTSDLRVIKNANLKQGITIVDAEQIVGNVVDTNNNKTTLYIFDIMYINSTKLTEEPFSIRCQRLQSACKILNEFLQTTSEKNIEFRVKNYETITKDNIKTVFKQVYKPRADYELDGLIITSPDNNYNTTMNFKWKPIEHMTIDFLAVKAHESLFGIEPYINVPGYTMYILFNGISENMQYTLGLNFINGYNAMFSEKNENFAQYHPIQFSPPINPYAHIYYDKNPDLDHKIIELAYNVYQNTNDLNDKNQNINEKNKNVSSILTAIADKNPYFLQWRFVAVRTDREGEVRYYGNDYRIAEITISNYVSKFGIDDLSALSRSYFNESIPNGEIYKPGNRLRREIIDDYITKIHNVAVQKINVIVDLAAGRGADLKRYQKLAAKVLIAVDNDADAIAELIKRRFSPQYSSKKNRVDNKIVRPSHNMTVHALVRDLSAPYDETAALINKNFHHRNCDMVVCNFAIHYFCDTSAGIKNFVSLVATLLHKRGVFMATYMDGASIFAKLRGVKNGDSWILRANDCDKYMIRRLYSADTLAQFGQKVSIKLPFATEMYEESLVNTDYLLKEFARANMQVMFDVNFAEVVDQYIGDKKLLPEDIEYCKLFRMIILVKN